MIDVPEGSVIKYVDASGAYDRDGDQVLKWTPAPKRRGRLMPIMLYIAWWACYLGMLKEFERDEDE